MSVLTNPQCPAAASRPRATLGIACAVLAWLAAASLGVAGEPTRELRRVFVPADRPEVWPTDGERYLPVEAARLRTLLREPPAEPRQPTSLRLEARWSGGALIGEGRLRVVSPAWVRWPAAPMRVHNPRWETGEPASLGWWPGDDGAGEHGLAAPRAGVLTFDFQVWPKAGRTGANEFLLPTPAALQRRLQLTAPSWLRFSGPRLIAEPIGPDTDDPTWRRWRLEAPPGEPLLLLAEDTRKGSGASPAPFVASERTRLEIGPDAIAVTSQFLIDAPGLLSGAVRVASPAGLALQSADLDGEPAKLLYPPAAGADPPVVEVELPPPVGRSGGLLRLRGLAPVPLDEDFPAPRPRLVGAEWTEGVLTVSIRRGLRLVDAAAERDAALAPTPGGTARLPSTLAYQLYGPRARVKLRVAPEEAPVAVRLSRELRLGFDTDQAEVRVGMAPTPGPLPTGLEFALAAGWRVESVECSPATLLDHWSVAAIGPARLLRLALDPEAAADRTAETSLVIRAQRPAPPRRGGLTTFDTLEVLRPIGARTLSDRWQVTPPEARVLTPVGPPLDHLIADGSPAIEGNAAVGLDETGPPQPQQDPKTQQEIEQSDTNQHKNQLDKGVERLAVELGEATPEELRRWGVRVARRRVSTASGLSISAKLGDDGIAYRLMVDFGRQRPGSEPIELWFDTPLPADPVWSEPRSGRPVDATPDNTRRRWRVRPVDPEAWSGVAVDAILPDNGVQPIPLAALVGAPSRTAEVRLGPGLASLGWPDFPSGSRVRPDPRGSTGGLLWRYRPADWLNNRRGAEAGEGAPAGLVWRRLPDDRPPAALRRLSTRFNAAGAARHTAEYQTAATGQPLRFRLPAGAALLEAVAGGGSVSVQPAADGWHKIDAASLNGTTDLTLRYRTQAGPLRHGDVVSPRPPETPLPPKAFLWRVESSAGRRLVVPGSWSPSVFSRLLGGKEFWYWSGWPGVRESSAEASSATELIVGQGSLARARIEDPTMRRRWLVAALSLAGLAAAIVFGCRRRLWLLGAAAALAAALTAPAGGALLTTAAWIGWLAGAPFAVVARGLAARFRAAAAPARPPATGSTTITQPVACLLIACSLGAPSGAAPVGPSTMPPAAPERVLLPVDGRGRAVGDKVYARESWLRALEQTEAPRGERASGDAVVRSVECRGAFRRSPTGSLEPAVWTLRVELTALSRSTRVVLPLRRSDAAWEPNVKIDGLSRPIAWDPSGARCVFEIDAPGDARAEFRFTPTTRLTDGESCVRLSLFPTSDARLAITFPADQRDLRTPFLRSLTTRDEATGRLRAPLAGAGEVLVCWTDEPRPRPVRAVDIDLMQWVRVSPRGVYVLVKGQAVEPDGLGAPWRFRTPSGCQRIDPPEDESEDRADGRVAARRVAFRLPRSAVEGRIRPPRVEVAGGRVRSRSLAVSIDGPYDWSVNGGENARPLDPDAFLDRWRPEGLVPDIDRAMLVDSAAPVIAVSRPPIDDLLAQRLTATAGRRGTACRYAAEYAAARRRAGQRAYQVDEALRVRAVRVESDERSLVSRWTRPRPDRLVVFFDNGASPTGGLRVSVEGDTWAPPRRRQTINGRAEDPRGPRPPLPPKRSAPDEPGESSAVPLIADADSDQPLAVTLACRDGVLLETVGPTWRAAPGGNGTRDTAPVATASTLPGSTKLRFRQQINEPRARLTSVAWFEPSGGAVVWQLDGEVTAGRLRRIPLAAASGVIPGEVLGPAGVAIEPASHAGEADYWLVLPQRLAPGQRLSISVRLSTRWLQDAPAPATPLRVVGPLTARTVVALQTPANVREGAWNWSGLTPIEPPTGVGRSGSDGGSYRFLTPASDGVPPVVGWSLPRERSSSAGPAVELADHQIALGPAGGVATRSTLVVATGGGGRRRVQLPPDAELTTALVDGRWSPVRRLADGQWELLVASREARCVLTLSSSSPAAGRGLAGSVIAGPFLLDPTGKPRHADVTLYEIALPDPSTTVRLPRGDRLAARQLRAARSHAEAHAELAGGTLTAGTIEGFLPAAGRRVRILVDGPHPPPTIHAAGRLDGWPRYAFAVLVLAAAAAVGSREVWASGRRDK